MSEPIRKQFTAAVDRKGIDEQQRTVRMVITTGAVDRDNDTISPTGWDISDFLKSPSVLWAHDYSHLPVARAKDVTLMGDSLTSTAQFPPKGTYDFADTVFELLKLGILNACSVGFKPLEFAPNAYGGTAFARQSLLEWSFVPVPANPQALVTMAKSKGVRLTDAIITRFKNTKGHSNDVVLILKDDRPAPRSARSQAFDDFFAGTKGGRRHSQADLSDLQEIKRLVRDSYDVHSAHAAMRKFIGQKIHDTIWDTYAAVIDRNLKANPPRRSQGRGDDIVLRLVDEPRIRKGEPFADPATVKAILPGVVRDALKDVVHDSVKDALRRWRGRID